MVGPRVLAVRCTIDDQVTRAEVRTVPPSPAPATTTSRRRRFRPFLIIGALILLGLLAWRLFGPAGGGGGHAKQGAQAQRVGAAKVGTANLHVILSGLGTVTPLATITVQTQINGLLMSVGYKEGQIVQKGDFLAQIDPRPYQVALEQAEGTLAHDTELLHQAQSDLQRYLILNRQDSISKQQAVDQQFLVKQDQGTVLEDQGTIDNDKLNLAYCHITSPVTGRVGLRLIDPGNYVQTSSSTGLVVVTQLQPISVIFVLPEDEVPDVWQALRAGQTLQVTAWDRTNSTQLAAGTLETVDNEVDTTTGTVKLRATFANADDALFPNQFVNARLLERTLQNVTVAPVAAVQHGAPGTFVYLVKPDSTVGVQVVKTGVIDGDQVQILSGVKPGDEVVVDGVDQLRDGAKIRITPDQGDQAATVNNGPGAPPGQQPANSTPVPQSEQVKPHAHRKQQGQPEQNGQ
jgi:multidrug efflux system membrane fusion protein